MLVAGIGNVFFGDDGFGVEVARRLEGRCSPEVKVADFGIRGIHLAYEILSGYDAAIVIDATPRGNAPGTLYVIEPDPAGAAATADPHSMVLEGVFAFMRTLGGVAPRLVVVGCEPAVAHAGVGLSEPVGRAVDRAVALVIDLIDKELRIAAAASSS